MGQAPTLAVVGAGWAGLSAAIRATQVGWQVSLFEMAGQAGGRARSVRVGDLMLDNGQHILIGAYVRTLDLLRTVGVDIDAAFKRQPLTLRHVDGRGLSLPPGHVALSLVRALLSLKGLNARERLNLLRVTSAWAWHGFECDASWTVDDLCRDLSPAARTLLIDPLCVAALNTPSSVASGNVFLRVLRDALMSGSGSSDLLLPRVPLGDLLPAPGLDWLIARGANVHTGHRVMRVSHGPAGWLVDDTPFDAVLLASSPTETARLLGAVDGMQAWIRMALNVPHEPIITVYLDAPGARLPEPMLALAEDANSPAQFVFDHGQISQRDGLLACVISGAGPWVERGPGVTEAAVIAQLQSTVGPWIGPGTPRVLSTLAEKRATFRCLPKLLRPHQCLADGLVAAGDYLEGPYPATIEGAVRSGESAVSALTPQDFPRSSTAYTVRCKNPAPTANDA